MAVTGTVPRSGVAGGVSTTATVLKSAAAAKVAPGLAVAARRWPRAAGRPGAGSPAGAAPSGRGSSGRRRRCGSSAGRSHAYTRDMPLLSADRDAARASMDMYERQASRPRPRRGRMPVKPSGRSHEHTHHRHRRAGHRRRRPDPPPDVGGERSVAVALGARLEPRPGVGDHRLDARACAGPSRARRGSSATTRRARLGRPGGRPSSSTGISRPVTARAASITWRTEKPVPLPRL